jgi:hypothetical protein
LTSLLLFLIHSLATSKPSHHQSHHDPVVVEMRLRLQIERNALPTTQALWPVRSGKSTIAQLLQSVNEIFPLESDTWGLEDYSVSIGGYECLHYHEVGVVCKEDDELVIRPLQYVDVRARTMTGRDQISQDGRHLVDGIPYGKPNLKGAVRPKLRIPPRKRQKLGREQPDDASDGQLLLTANGVDVDSDEDEEDEDFVSAVSESDSDTKEKAVEAGASTSDDSDSSTDSSSMSSSSESSSDDSSDSEAEQPTAKKKQGASIAARTGLNNDRSSRNAQINGAGSKRKRASNDEVDTTDGVEGPSPNVGVPNNGKSETRTRNARRRDTKRLKILKDKEILPVDASLRDLQRWQENTPGWEGLFSVLKTPATDGEASVSSNQTRKTTNGTPATEEMRDHNLEDVESQDPNQRNESNERNESNVDISDQRRTAPAPNTRADIESKREKLLAAIATGGIDVTALKQRKHDSESGGDRAGTQAGMSSDGLTPSAAVESMVTPRRSQLDLAGSKRLLYGSLGVRVPKTPEERERTQKKLAERATRNPSSDIAGQDAAVDAQINGELNTTHSQQDVAADKQDQDPDSWKQKIDLTAVECGEEGITLSTPPFPFFQRWDPQQRKGKGAKRIASSFVDQKSSRKRKKTKSNQYQETYDKYNTDGQGDALNYDDADVDDEYWEEGALLNDDYEEESDDAVDDYPTLPEDLSTLNVLENDEAKLGDWIVYTELACDDATGWEPKMVSRTVKLVQKSGEDGDRWIVLLPPSDRKMKVYDDDGNRVYSKFEMPGNDDGEDEDVKEIVWNELGEVRLVQRAED